MACHDSNHIHSWFNVGMWFWEANKFVETWRSLISYSHAWKSLYCLINFHLWQNLECMEWALCERHLCFEETCNDPIKQKETWELIVLFFYISKLGKSTPPTFHNSWSSWCETLLTTLNNDIIHKYN